MTSLPLRTASLLALTTLLAACPGPSGEDVSCAGVDCSGHGTCSTASGAAACACEEGWAGAACDACAEGFQDHDGDGSCLATCATAALACGAHGACADASGTAACACEAGWAGAACERCAEGLQDHDADGVCQPTCAAAALACGAHGACADASGTATCACAEGWAGAACDACADGFQDHDADGSCLATCATAALACGAHGACVDATGTALCACEAGYAGAACDACAEGFQDHDGDAVCAPTCAAAALACGAHGACAAAALSCGGRGACTDASGTAACACDQGYAGAACETCDEGFQDHDGDTVCAPTCATAALACGAHGQCADASGTAACSCEVGYAGAACAECTDGFQDHDDDTICRPTCATAALSCGAHGDCADTSGTATCACDEGWAGEACAACAEGFQDHDGNGSCLAACATAGLSCGAHGECDDASGTAACSCEAGYAGDACAECADGFQDHDGNGTCLATCATSVLNCGAHGDCEDASGVARCACDTGYTGKLCSACAPGYEPGMGGSCVLAASGNTCANAVPLAVASGSVTGTTVGSGDDYQPSCLSNDAPDFVYVLTPTQNARVTFKVTGYDTVMYLRTGCTSADLACNDDLTWGSQYSQFQHDLVAGTTYYLFIDGYSGATGSFNLTLQVLPDPCAGDPCPGVPECQPNPDWLGYQCVCPAGTLPHDGSCVDDPCQPNPCTAANMNRCAPVFPAGHTCSCNGGYIDDGAGGCIADPNGKPWTVMVYLNADNNLDSYGYDDIAEMQAAGLNDQVNVVVLHDSSGPQDTRKLLITGNGQQVLQSGYEADMGSWQTLRDFGVWAVDAFPAHRYALVLWNHGAGWRSSAARPNVLKEFSNDDHGSYDGISLSNGDYARALAPIVAKAGRKLDLVGFDACLMGMYEVAHATAPYAHYLVASSETEPGPGWSYDSALAPLLANPAMGGDSLGIAIADSYWAEDTDNATQAVSDLGTLGALDAALSAFADQLRANAGLYAAINTQRNNTQTFDEPDHRDLRDFALRVSAMPTAPAPLKSAATALAAQVQATVIHNKTHSGYANSHGLAIYLPARNSGTDSDYTGAGATWSAATTWDEFLLDFAQ